MSPGQRTPPPGSPRLFSDAQTPAPPAGVYTANIDGGSRGNPGPAAYGVVLRDPNGAVILELAKQFGRDTNNVAEYYGLLAALDYAASRGISKLRIRSDSELLVRQMQGVYKVKSDDLKPLHERASKLSRQLTYFAIEHVRRELNSEADALANAALDQGVGNRSEIRKEKRNTATDPADSLARATPPKQAAHLPRKIRVRVERGALIPAEPLDLAEGTQLTIEIQKS
jgi:ribonuclease HI